MPAGVQQHTPEGPAGARGERPASASRGGRARAAAIGRDPSCPPEAMRATREKFRVKHQRTDADECRGKQNRRTSGNFSLLSTSAEGVSVHIG